MKDWISRIKCFWRLHYFDSWKGDDIYQCRSCSHCNLIQSRDARIYTFAQIIYAWVTKGKGD